MSYQQLDMLRPANRLRHEAEFHPGDMCGSGSVEDAWANKLEESFEEWRELDTIETHGINNPIVLHVQGERIMNGHHRIVRADAVNGNLEVPIRWTTGSLNSGGTGCEGHY